MSKYENFFTDLANTMSYLKAAAEGAAGTGKTWTMALIAVGLYKRIKSEKPIVIFDSEEAAKFLKNLFAENDIPAIVKNSQTLSDLAKTIDYCHEGNSDILIIDSMTPVYEGFLDAFRLKKGRPIQFNDWSEIKPIWRREFRHRYVTAKCHALFTGREGYTYEYQTNEDTGKRELVKTGVKMKAEGDTAYEPDLLIRMERFEKILDGEKKDIWREATVIKGRGGLVDGGVFRNPTYENFEPMVEYLLEDQSERPETISHDDSHLIVDGENMSKERRAKTETLEEVWATFDKLGLGTGKDDKQRKVTILERIFMTKSKSKIEGMSLDSLIDGLDRLERDAEVKSLMNKEKAA